MQTLAAGSPSSGPGGGLPSHGSKRKPRVMPDSLIRALMVTVSDSMKVGGTLDGSGISSLLDSLAKPDVAPESMKGGCSRPGAVRQPLSTGGCFDLSETSIALPHGVGEEALVVADQSILLLQHLFSSPAWTELIACDLTDSLRQACEVLDALDEAEAGVGGPGLPPLTPTARSRSNNTTSNSGKYGSVPAQAALQESDPRRTSREERGGPTARAGLVCHSQWHWSAKIGTTVEVSAGNRKTGSTTAGRLLRCANGGAEHTVMFDSSERSGASKRHFSSLRGIEQVKASSVTQRWQDVPCSVDYSRLSQPLLAQVATLLGKVLKKFVHINGVTPPTNAHSSVSGSGNGTANSSPRSTLPSFLSAEASKASLMMTSACSFALPTW